VTLVCGDCNSHNILETGGTDLIVGCPACGLPVPAAIAVMSPSGNLVHALCPPVTPAVTAPEALVTPPVPAVGAVPLVVESPLGSYYTEEPDDDAAGYSEP
jgi:hypothetical protein